ncbi:hypothetical protein NQ176_g6454 [Zarea fungicola]|uniref:Uncharacterized protein n=1 Tax=Zarea fungicola TaxID=93591 RepID=A0ACC1N366_9HYPO|nr:hypothetical protein NQ176_g6454 [Lecanicillium fungicola]
MKLLQIFSLLAFTAIPALAAPESTDREAALAKIKAAHPDLSDGEANSAATTYLEALDAIKQLDDVTIVEEPRLL